MPSLVVVSSGSDARGGAEPTVEFVNFSRMEVLVVELGSHVTRHTSHITHHTSHITRHHQQVNVFRPTVLAAMDRMEAPPPPLPHLFFPRFYTPCPPIQELDVDAVAAQAAGDDINRDI